MTSSGNEWSGFQRALGDFTFSLTAKLIVASLSKKLNNLVKSTKNKAHRTLRGNGGKRIIASSSGATTEDLGEDKCTPGCM